MISSIETLFAESQHINTYSITHRLYFIHKIEVPRANRNPKIRPRKYEPFLTKKMFLAFDSRLLLVILMGFVNKDECCQNTVGSLVANTTEFQLTHHYPIQNLSYDPFFFHKLTPQSDRSV